MKNDMKKLEFEALGNVSGGTSAETEELLEIIDSNPKLTTAFEKGLKYSKGDINGALEYMLYMDFGIEPALFEKKANSYRTSNGTKKTHGDVCEMLRNF